MIDLLSETKETEQVANKQKKDDRGREWIMIFSNRLSFLVGFLLKGGSTKSLIALECLIQDSLWLESETTNNLNNSMQII